MNATVARRFLGTLEPIVTTMYFAPEVYEEMGALGLDIMQGYFCSRAAPLGRATPATVTATFYNWNPEFVRRCVRWDIADPETVIEARTRGVTRALTRLLADEDGALPDVARATALLEEAAAACRPEGRALYAANAALPAPDEPLARLWHAANLLREYRGDGHIAVLTSHQVDAVEALAMQTPFVEFKPGLLFDMRQWPAEERAAAQARLVERGVLDDTGALTDAGWKLREMMERETDRLALPPFRALGDERCEEALALLQPLAEQILERRGVPGAIRRIARLRA